ncbi:MAG: ABC transporter ATP-binding protein [Anaerolineae bacterium]|nr:ABC transporter ATP-binding protein [Anaerolineae bacterium]
MNSPTGPDPNIAPVLDIQNATISYRLGGAWIDTVRNVSLQVQAGQTYGIVGESGSGKTTLLLGMMRYLADNGRVSEGKVLLEGEDLLTKSIPQMREIWGKKMSMVPQDPGGSLNPSLKIGAQVAEISKHHYGLSDREAWQRALDRLREVRIADAERVAQRYPHQLSGGMQQRVLIAMALSTEPRLLALDEPTTNLDVTTEAVVLDLFSELVRKHQTAAIYVTHNLGVVAQVCGRAAVLYAGEMMEDASVSELFERPLHPYTMELLSCVPRLGESQRGVRLRTIKGNIPSQRNLPKGCIFAPRCPLAIEHCFHVRPKVEQAAPGHTVSCHRWQEIASGTIGHDILGMRDTQPMMTVLPPKAAQRETLLEVDDVNKAFPVNASILDQISGKPKLAVRAVDHSSLTLAKGETIGIVGESGSGKTTLARCIVGLLARDSGEIKLTALELAPKVEDRQTEVLKRLQMVFQNPEESLNPYHTIGDALRRPLLQLAKVPADQVDARMIELLQAVHLSESYADRFPAELSGGEKQRAAIARAFATDPEIVVCDESVSALDVSVQASILNLLSELKAQKQTAYLFISHDLAVVSYLADTIAVVYLGQVMEIGSRDAIFNPPQHPYTEALISAVPIPDPKVQTARIRLEADIPSPVNIPTGCRFHTRCPRKIGAICEQQEPPWVNAGEGHFIRCHIPLDELKITQSEPKTGLKEQREAHA